MEGDKVLVMKIYNVVEIFDNGDFITIVTPNGSVHLPTGSDPSIVINPIKSIGVDNTISVTIDLYAG